MYCRTIKKKELNSELIFFDFFFNLQFSLYSRPYRRGSSEDANVTLHHGLEVRQMDSKILSLFRIRVMRWQIGPGPKSCTRSRPSTAFAPLWSVDVCYFLVKLILHAARGSINCFGQQCRCSFSPQLFLLLFTCVTYKFRLSSRTHTRSKKNQRDDKYRERNGVFMHRHYVSWRVVVEKVKT